MNKSTALLRRPKEKSQSHESIIPTDLDSIRSTFLGKFYEGIVAKWLEEKRGFVHQKGKPQVWWNEILELKPTDEFSTNLDKALKDKKKHDVHTNSDGLFEKNGELYLWEAKNWPKWNEGKELYKQVKDLLSISPYILAKQVKISGQNKKIKGILFSWWEKFENYEELETSISSLAGIPFKFYFTSDILDDCRENKCDWYIRLIKEQKNNIVEFCDELLE